MSIIIRILLIAVSAGLLWHFTNIWRFGSHYIQEPSLGILLFEALGVGAILILAILNFIKLIKERNERNSEDSHS